MYSDKEEEVLKDFKGTIISRAKKASYKNPRYDIDDLIEEANLAAIKAIRSFDPERGVKFITYLIWCIDLEIQKFIWNNAHDLHVSEWHSRKDREGVGSIKTAVRLDAMPHTGSGGDETSKIEFDFARKTDSDFTLNTPTSSGIIPSPADTVENWDTNAALREEIKKLPANERVVIENRYFHNKTLVEVASQLKTSKQAIHGWEKQGLKRLARGMKKRLGE